MRHVCCETGYSGDPIDPVFRDREVFADFFTRYYTDYEPENALVLEAGGKVVGYLLGSTRTRFHPWASMYLMVFRIAPKVVWRLSTGQYNQASRNFLWWSLTRGGKETPAAPSNTAHFHFNLLPDYRNAGKGLALWKTFQDKLTAKNVKKVYGQIQTFDDRRSQRAFERFGFYEYDKKEMTKFRDFQSTRVYCSTVVKDLP